MDREKKKIMIIDDSPTIRKTAAFFLGDKYEVIEVDNGYNALTQIIDHKPDLVLLDILMPKLNGYDTCNIIKQKPEFENLPIIMLSSKDGILDKAKGSLYGCDEYMTKPFVKDAFIKTIESFLKD